MNEKLEITNFAGIEHWEIELNSINILIGPQASGKSVTAKLFYFFKSVFSILKNGRGVAFYKLFLEKKFESYFPVDTWGKEAFEIKYTIDNFWIEIKRKYDSSRLSFSFSDGFKTAFRRYNELSKDVNLSFESVNMPNMNVGVIQREAETRKLFFSEFREKYNNILTAEQIFIPAGRSFFANLQSNIFTLLNSKQVFDPILLEFGSSYEAIKAYRKITLLDDRKKIKFIRNLEALVKNILHGKHIRHNEEDFLVHENEREVHINFASSGQQEALPLVLFLKFILNTRLASPENGIVVYIEEPEAHLFPQSQKSVVEALALLANVSTTKYQFIITTHSPYILASFNNLIEAGNIVKENPDKKEDVFKIVDESLILKYDDVNAYSLKDGHCEKIMDDEMRLISPTILDEVSNDISVQFGELLDL